MISDPDATADLGEGRSKLSVLSSDGRLTTIINRMLYADFLPNVTTLRGRTASESTDDNANAGELLTYIHDRKGVSSAA